MTKNNNGCFILSKWEGRAETPDELAARFLRMIDSFEQIDPLFSLWTCGARRPTKLETVRDRYAKEIAAGIEKDDWGIPIPIAGYWFGAFTRDIPDSRCFAVNCTAGSILKTPFPNKILFTTSPMDSSLEPDVVSYRIFRPALLAIVDAWDPVKAAAYPDDLNKFNDGSSFFPAAWIQYLCPGLAGKITPPSTALVEYLPNGGLLMSATTETFDVDNPQHLAAARDMGAAMALLDRLPWPSES